MIAFGRSYDNDSAETSGTEAWRVHGLASAQVAAERHAARQRELASTSPHACAVEKRSAIAIARRRVASTLAVTARTGSEGALLRRDAIFQQPAPHRARDNAGASAAAGVGSVATREEIDTFVERWWSPGSEDPGSSSIVAAAEWLDEQV